MATTLPRRAFGAKDVFTLVNLAAGVVALHHLLGDQPRRAGYAVVIGYLAGDLIDGQVARATRTSNRFGAELDSIVDHFVHVIVPALIFYSVYRRAGHELIGLGTAGVLVGTATIRHARLAAERFDFSLCWCGLPRTVSGFVAMSFPLSTIWFKDNPERFVTGAVVVAALSVLNLIPIPYMTHRGARAMQAYVKVGVLLFLASPVVLYALDRRYFFDVFFTWTAGYAVVGWIPIRKDERAAFYAEYRRWSAALTR